jgi:SAM-dependent methyltransferase
VVPATIVVLRRFVPLVIGVNLSAAAVRAASASHPGVTFARADALALPLRDGGADVLIDRGCFHYVDAADRTRYAREAQRMLRRGGRFLLRACRSAAAVPNDIGPPVLERVFRGWHIDQLTAEDIPSGHPDHARPGRPAAAHVANGAMRLRPASTSDPSREGTAVRIN